MRRALALSVVFLFGCPTPSSFSQTTWQAEWEQRQEAAKKEGKVVFSIPPSAELRKVLEDSIKRKFGFEVEVVPSAAAKIIRRIADEAFVSRAVVNLANSQGGQPCGREFIRS